jgi:hypothetical protein
VRASAKNKSKIRNPKSKIEMCGLPQRRSKRPPDTSGGSDHENADRWRPATITTNRERAVRCQLFDDSILAARDVTGIFPKLRGFLDTA